MSDVLVIGGGAAGLTAATYMARVGRSVTLLEASDAAGGLCRDIQLENGWTAPGAAHLLYALDPQVAKDLRLVRHGLRFSHRDMALTGVGVDGRQLKLCRGVHSSARHLMDFSETDAQTYAAFRRDLMRQARRLRAHWWRGERLAEDITSRKFVVTSAAALLNSQFEADALKALLAFDATAGGLSVLEPGSALALVWRLAQEVGGLQGAVAVPAGGMSGLIDALTRAALNAGVELRTVAEVKNILVQDGRASGVQLSSGEILAAPVIFSSLPLEKTLSMLPPGAAGLTPRREQQPMVGEAKLLLALSHVPWLDEPPFSKRFVTVDRLESLIGAHAAARAGILPDELPCEFIITPALQSGALLSLHVRPVPLTNWASHAPRLVEKVLARLELLIPGLRNSIMAQAVMAPDDMGPRIPVPRVDHMLASPRDRVTTGLAGLYLCGASAEPVPCVSGRAARFATALALKEMP